MMQDLDKATYGPIAITKVIGIAMFHCCIEEKNSANKSDICSIQFWCKFYLLHFCQISFKMVFISHCYHESHRGELFETQCTVVISCFLFVIRSFILYSRLIGSCESNLTSLLTSPLGWSN